MRRAAGLGAGLGAGWGAGWGAEGCRLGDVRSAPRVASGPSCPGLAELPAELARAGRRALRRHGGPSCAAAQGGTSTLRPRLSVTAEHGRECRGGAVAQPVVAELDRLERHAGLAKPARESAAAILADAVGREPEVTQLLRAARPAQRLHERLDARAAQPVALRKSVVVMQTWHAARRVPWECCGGAGRAERVEQSGTCRRAGVAVPAARAAAA